MFKKLIKKYLTSKPTIKSKLIKELITEDKDLRDQVLINILDGKEIMSLRINDLNDFRDGEVINIPDNTVFYKTIISGSIINANKLNLGSYVTITGCIGTDKPINLE